jgi:hypothetical protein
MVSNFLLKNGKAISNKDVVLIGSATQLLVEGLEGYIGSLLATIDRLSVGGRGGCTVLPAPLLLLGGTPDPLLIKNLMDLFAWVRLSGLDPEGVLNEAIGVIEDSIKSHSGESIVWPHCNLKLPLNLPSRKPTCVAITSSTLPREVPLIAENLFIGKLVNGLNSKIDAKLDCDPYTARLPANSTSECLDFVIIGGQTAESIARELTATGASCQLLLMPNYRASTVHSGKIEDGLKSLRVNSSTIFVVQIFDSGCFMVRTEEGGLIPICKRADGSYHVDGMLELINTESQYDLFQQVMIELRDYKNNILIFLAPIPCYLTASCCEDLDHASNRSQADFSKKMEEGVFAVRQNIKNFAFKAGLRRCHTISTWGKIRKMDKIWTGPVSIEEDCHKAIAKAVLEAVEMASKKRTAASSKEERSAKRYKGQQTEIINGAGPIGTGGQLETRGGRGGRGGGGGGRGGGGGGRGQLGGPLETRGGRGGRGGGGGGRGGGGGGRGQLGGPPTHPWRGSWGKGRGTHHEEAPTPRNQIDGRGRGFGGRGGRRPWTRGQFPRGHYGSAGGYY